jgi:hypothetical protein
MKDRGVESHNITTAVPLRKIARLKSRRDPSLRELRASDRKRLEQVMYMTHGDLRAKVGDDESELHGGV